MHLTSRCAFGKRVYDFLNYVKSVQMKIVKKCQLTVIFDVAYSEKLHASSNSDSNSDSDALYASSNSDSDSDCDFQSGFIFSFQLWNSRVMEAVEEIDKCTQLHRGWRDSHVLNEYTQMASKTQRENENF